MHFWVIDCRTFHRVVGTVVARQQKPAAVATLLDTVVPSVSTRTGKITITFAASMHSQLMRTVHTVHQVDLLLLHHQRNQADPPALRALEWPHPQPPRPTPLPLWVIMWWRHPLREWKMTNRRGGYSAYAPTSDLPQGGLTVIRFWQLFSQYLHPKARHITQFLCLKNCNSSQTWWPKILLLSRPSTLAPPHPRASQ